MTVTPQVVDKFVFLLSIMDKRHPERSEGSPDFGSIFDKLRSFATLRMTYLGSYIYKRIKGLGTSQIFCWGAEGLALEGSRAEECSTCGT
jgi:hypothetical protein